jgi:ABC-type sugar transport system substrate-binding protein
MKRKTILAFVLSLMMVFVVTGYAQSAQRQLVFGNIAYDMADIWNQYGAEAFQWAADQKGVEVILLDSQNSAERSVDLMQELIARRVDGISIFPISPDQAAMLIRMANEANIPITVENLKIEENAGDFISIAACLYDDIGYAAIKYVAENFPGSRVLMVAGAVGGGVWETYKIGIDKALEEFGDKVSMPDIIHGDWATDRAHTVTQSFLASGREFDVVFANNDLMAMGVHIALEEAGLAGQIPIISTGGAPEGLNMIRDGVVTANMTAPVSLQGLLTFRNLWRHTNGRPSERFYPLPIIPIDRDNLDQAIRWDVVDQSAANAIGGLD